jgi:hypothetical protein
MTQTILIGLNRRITLDELYSLSLGGGGDAKLEMMVHTTTSGAGEDEHNDGDDDDAAGVAVAAGNEEEHPSLLIAALRDLVLNSTSDAATDAAAAAAGGELLSEGATIASLALLSLTLSQGRVIRGECATQLSSALVDLVNSILSLREEGCGGVSVRLPANGTEFAKSVNALLLQNQQQQQQVGVVIPVEDKPYLGRLILLARVSLMLAQGTLFHFCFLVLQLDYFSRKLPV